MRSPAVKLVILEINDGTFSRGFDVTARIIVDRRSEQIFKAQLPAAPDLPHLYDQWQASYRALGNATLISVSTTQVTNLSIIGDCTHLSAELKQRFNQWLNSDSFRTLERSLLLAIGPDTNVRFMVQTLDRYLRRLPWQTWDLFEQHYPTAEVMLSHPITPPSKPFNAPVRILAVEGNTDGTEACLDLAQLNRLPQTQITVLHQPTSSELIDRLWHEDWDMFFFLGHSDSTDDDQNGQIVLNATETVTLSEIHHALKNALKNGLKLAIFNSCNGLGLAQRLADLNIPYVIVMRERVPDQVALEFFKTFLTSFSQGKVLHSALHIARQKLAGYGDRYPCAHWLPVLCQNPNAPELRYPRLKQPYRLAIATSIIALSVLGLSGLWPSFSHWYLKETQFSDRTSLGENQLDHQIKNQYKTAGLEAFSRGDFALAEKEFSKSLKQDPNDPETRIYLNNATIAPAPNKVRIVVSVPLTTSPYVAREILRGVAQRQTEFNQQITGQYAGLEVVIGSDDNDKDIAVNLASHWVKDKTILAIVGHNAGNASIPASEIYEAAKLPMISPTTYVSLSPDSRTYTFQMQPNNFPFAQLLAEYANETFAGNQIAGCVDSESQDNKEFEKNFRNTISKSSSVTYISNICAIDQEGTASEKVKVLVDQKIKVIVIAPFVNRLEQSFAIAREARKAGLMILGTPSFYNQATLNEPMMNGIIFPVAWMPYLPSTANSKFLRPSIKTSDNSQFYQQALTLWNIPTTGYEPSITWRTAMAYDVTGMLTTIVANVSPQEPINRQYIQKELHNKSFKGVTGPIDFDRYGSRNALTLSNQGVMVTVQPNDTPWKELEFVPISSDP
jgi:branched-chain amino acid transport system substrate-binding protein